MSDQPRGKMAATIVVALIAGALAGAAGGAAVGIAVGRDDVQPPAPLADGDDREPVTATSTSLTIEGGDSEAIKAAIEKADPAVVNVTTVETVRNRWGELLDVPVGQGTGFVMDAERGLILTNEHVVGNAPNPVVTMVQPDGSTVEMNAQTLAASPADDIAVLQVEANNLPVLEFGDPTSLEVGDWIIAIGSPFGLDHTATVGVVSALGRRFKVPDDRQAMPVERIYDDMIQTDAAINSGNSGGPLINLAGDVVGMNTLITSPSGASAGVGFAISASKLRVVVENLLGEAVVGFRWKIVDPRWLEGAEAPEGHYVQIRDVAPRAPAAAAGLREDDLILSIGGTDIREPADIRAALQDAEPGDTLEMDVFRYAPGDGGRRETLDVTVVSRGDL